jgi:hypothetical protein
MAHCIRSPPGPALQHWTATLTWMSLLIDCEEDWTLRAVLVGMLREDDG